MGEASWFLAGLYAHLRREVETGDEVVALDLLEAGDDLPAAVDHPWTPRREAAARGDVDRAGDLAARRHPPVLRPLRRRRYRRQQGPGGRMQGIRVEHPLPS